MRTDTQKDQVSDLSVKIAEAKVNGLLRLEIAIEKSHTHNEQKRETKVYNEKRNPPWIISLENQACDNTGKEKWKKADKASVDEINGTFTYSNMVKLTEIESL